MRKPMLATAALAAAVLAGPAQSTSLRERTFTLSVAAQGASANGASTRPAISGAGNVVAFESAARNLAPDPNGPVVDVFARDVIAGSTRLVSRGIDGRGADGASGNATVGGDVIAFHSEATNLVAGDTNGVRDVFARVGAGALVRLSEPAGGGDANGPSGEPDVSDDGRFVAFSSTASNLVPGDGNGESDVFVRDLRAGTITRVSGGANGPSRAPAISADGRYVTFYSLADDLVDGDENGVGDVFLAELQTGRLEVATVGRVGLQNQAVVAPFSQISDVSANGRFVVFDSDATNLVPGDRNEDTDVFVRDRWLRTTRRVSVGAGAREGDNDSFFPTLTPDGRYVAFQSFAENLAPGDGPREDIFVYDRSLRMPAVMSVGARGQVRERESVPQLLQRPAISRDGQLVAFTSTAGNLAPDDARGLEDVFLRVAASPRIRSIRSPDRVVTRRRPRLRVQTDDPRATALLCTLDRRRIPCRDGGRLPRLRRGRHFLRVRAGGPGMLYERRGHTRRFVVR